MRAEPRALLIDALRDAYCWHDELTTDSSRTIESIAAREKKTERSIRMTLSLAFLSPTLVKAAIDGRLPRGFGVKRLMDLPMGGSDQCDIDPVAHQIAVGLLDDVAHMNADAELGCGGPRARRHCARPWRPELRRRSARRRPRFGTRRSSRRRCA